ncbi:MAG TPA: hypothetical protein VNN79_11695 [Actinomycetota bacterium]|nr:hypothetical protein [Actinomycetota bacterium]
MQQLLGRSAAADLLTRALQRADEEMAIGLGECGGCVFVHDQPLGRCGPFHEVRRRDLDTSYPRVQAVERLCVFEWRALVKGIARQQVHRVITEAVALVDTRFDPRLERRDGALGRSEPLGEFDLELGDLLPSQSYSSEDVTRQEAESELVRVVDHDDIVDRQVKRFGEG